MTEELTPSQAAERIGTTTRTIQRWIEAGRWAARRVGRRLRVASVALDAFVAAAGAASRADATTAHGPGASPRRIFIANRGEIARRIRRTVELGEGTAFVPGE